MEKINAVVAWAKENGAVISDDVSFAVLGPANYGARSSSNGSSIKVPVKLLVKLSDAVAGLGLENAEELLKKPTNINAFLKVYLARERAMGLSAFQPYIDSLPSAAEINSPYVWSAEDKASLKGTNLGSSLRDNLGHLVEEWWSVINLVPESLPKPEHHFVNMKFYYEQKFYDEAQLHEYLVNDPESNWTSFPAYLWASMILKSRSFPSSLLKTNENTSEISKIDLLQEDVTMLIPVIDLLNHSPRAEVTWSVSDGMFTLQSSNNSPDQLYNNYGRKGNEELLLAYGFCLEDNSADSVALKIKVPVQLLPELEAAGVTLPKLSDYTTSVVASEKKSGETAYSQYEDGLLFFITKERIPEDLVRVFQWLVRSKWETSGVTVRMQLSGLNHLRQALESKAALIEVGNVGGKNGDTIKTYLAGQKKILSAGVTQVKRMEKELLAEHKSQILTLKSVYKKDEKFAQSLLVTMGVTSYDDIVDQGYSDQVWLLWLIRCYNRDVYDQGYMPEWVQAAFAKMDAETEMDPAEVVQFQGLYENLIIPMNRAVPEIYNVGKWTVREMIVSTRLLDTIGFVRGKQQECMLVNNEAV